MAAGAGMYEVQRETVIDAPAASVCRELVDFHRWKDWSPWEDVDPAMERTFSGTDSGVGAVYAWQGNRKAGAGRMEIVDVTEQSQVRIDLEFLKPFKAHNKIDFSLSSGDDGTRVTWTMTGRKTFMTRVMGIFTSMDKLVGKDFEKGLAQLKAEVEAGT